MKTGNLDAGDFDRQAATVIPCYEEIHRDVIDTAAHAVPSPKVWLDTGCGTGKVVSACLDRFPGTHFIMADPGREMLDIAVAKTGGRAEYILGTTDSLTIPDGSVDVITAVLCHHYCTREERIATERNCLRMLRDGGVLVTVEHTAPETEEGLRIALAKWRSMQISAGRGPEVVDQHLTRYNTEYFPITAREHIDQLRGIGFRTAEMFRLSYIQGGFYAIK